MRPYAATKTGEYRRDNPARRARGHREPHRVGDRGSKGPVRQGSRLRNLGALAFALLLAGCMRCDQFQLACPTGKSCVDGWCTSGPPVCLNDPSLITPVYDCQKHTKDQYPCWECQRQGAEGCAIASGDFAFTYCAQSCADPACLAGPAKARRR